VTQLLIAALLAGSLIVAAVLIGGRYSVAHVPGGQVSSVYVLDRFSGEVRRCNFEGCNLLRPGPTLPEQ
jgi:hypothetical protein